MSDKIALSDIMERAVNINDEKLIEKLRNVIDDHSGGDAVILVQRQLLNKVVGRFLALSRIAAVAVPVCATCGGTGKEARNQICRDCDEPDALSAPASAEPVKVMPLPWIMAGHDAVAKSPVGPYEILKAGSFWAIFVNSENTAISRHENMDDAKDAAQADFEERIRSALA